MKVYGIFLLCIMAVWGFARVSANLDRRMDPQGAVWEESAVIVDPLAGREADVERARAIVAEQQAMEIEAREEGVDLPGDCPTAETACNQRFLAP